MQKPLASIRLFLIAFFATFSLVAPSHSQEAAPSSATTSSDATVSFNKEIRPILSDHCILCHGSDEESREADVRFDVPDGVDLKKMVTRITSTDPDEVMPPSDSGDKLSPDEIETLKRWIAE